MAKTNESLRKILDDIKPDDVVKLRVRGDKSSREYKCESVVEPPASMPEGGPTLILVGKRGATFKVFWSWMNNRSCVVLLSTGGERTRTEQVVALEFERGPSSSLTGQTTEPDPLTDPMLWPSGFHGRPHEGGVECVADSGEAGLYVDLAHAIAGAWRVVDHRRRVLTQDRLADRLKHALGRTWDERPRWVADGVDLLHPETEAPVSSLDDALALAEFFARQYADDDCAVHELHAVQQRVARLEKRVVELSGHEQVLRRIGAALGMPATASALEIGMTVSLRMLGPASLGPASPVPPVVETWSTIGKQLAAAGYAHLDPALRGKAK